MLFKNIIYSAMVVGILSGLLLSLAQHAQISPLIYAAETFETSSAAPHDHAPAPAQAQAHSEAAWAPADGIERIVYTVIADVLAAIGFAALLLAGMSLARLKRNRHISIPIGGLWGLAGFVAFFAAPALGLHPEIPGMQAAALEHRQLWWVATVLVSIAGLAVIAFATGVNKIGGGILLAIPHIIGAPQTDAAIFSHPDPQAVLMLTELHHTFITASTLVNGGFWLVLGVLSAIALQQWPWQDNA